MKHALLILCVVGLVGCGSSSAVAPTPVPTPAPAPAPPPTPFQGVFVGLWTKTQCSETGGAVGVGCTGLGTGGGLNMTLTQSGSTVQGTVLIGSFQLSVSGPISSAQELTLTGQGRQSGGTINLAAWRTTISGNLMLGSFAFIVAPDDARQGTVTIQATLQSVVKQ